MSRGARPRWSPARPTWPMTPGRRRDPNGTATVCCLATGQVYHELNYLTDQGEVGNAGRTPHRPRTASTTRCDAAIAVIESGPLAATISANYAFAVPQDCAYGKTRMPGWSICRSTSNIAWRKARLNSKLH